MENQEDIAQEILELREEMNYLIEEQKILDAFFKKGMDNNKYKELLLQKNEIEKNYLKDSVRIDLKWSELINQLYQNRININLTEITTEIENIDKEEKNKENKEILKENVILAEKNKLLNKFSEFHLEKIKKKY